MAGNSVSWESDWKKIESKIDRTLDQVIADQVGQETPFRTLEFSCNSHQDNKESIFFDNISPENSYRNNNS